MIDQRAIIDIGSNTVRMVIYGGPPRAPVILFNEKVTARLGRGVAETGLLSGKSKAAALAALGRYAALIELHGVRSVETVATAAVRDAANGAKFLEAVAALGLNPRLLSGEEEAVTSAMGVIGAFPGARGVVADLGGGSLELVHVDGQECEHGTSLPLGALRLPQLRAGGSVTFGQRIRKVVKSAKWTCPPGETLYLVGGSHRAIARFAMQALTWPLDDPHGFELSPEDALRICRMVMRAKVPALVPGLAPSRQVGLSDTAALLAVLLKQIRPSRLVFSSWGLREGLLHSALAAPARAQDPLLAGVSTFAETLGVSAADAAMVAGWTAAALPADGAHRESLRLAATMLALGAQRLEPNLRAQHAAEWALRKRWIGVDSEGRAVMAACILANAGRNAISPVGLERLASPESLREAQAWGLAIRLCRRFSGISAQALANSALTVDGARLVLSVQPGFGALYTDPIEKDLRALAEKLGLQPVFQLAAPQPITS